MAELNWSFSQSFTAQFQAMRSELESKISAAKDLSPPSQENVQELAILLAKATKALADATGSIPTYDQKQYEIQLKSAEKLIEEIRSSIAPKSKFAFKRKPKAATPQPAPATPLATETGSATVEPIQSDSQATLSTNLVLSSQSNKYLTRSDLPEHPQQTDLSLSDLNGCIVNLLPPSNVTDDKAEHIVLTALHARDLTNCVLLLPSIEGSALLHDMSNCIIVLGCHQFRMHSSKKIDIFLSISSNPIIEHCTGLRFSQYPSSLAFSLSDHKEPPPLSVQDFSHIRPTPSPNFSFLDDGDKETIEAWLLGAYKDSSCTTRLSTVIPN